MRKILFLLVLLVISVHNLCFAQLDRTKYIGLDEIKPGMEAYCLTVYRGTEIEKFDLRVISVVKGARPGNFSLGGRDSILVMGLDDRFIHTGPVQGCSGSPVYIDGRMAGALAVGFNMSKDPLYGVTPIGEMIESSASVLNRDSYISGSTLDAGLFRGLKLENIAKSYLSELEKQSSGSESDFAIPLLCSLSEDKSGFATKYLSKSGFKVYSMGQTGTMQNISSELKPGGVVTIPLVSGDVSFDALGTVTEVDGDKVYAFGHSFMGQGNINLPMATGYVHTIVSHLISSFKFGQSGPIIGSFKADTSTAIYGEIGPMAPLIDLNVTVKRHNDIQRSYSCKVAKHEKYTPLLINAAVLGVFSLHSELPADHLVKYDCSVSIEGHDELRYSNAFANKGVRPLAFEIIGVFSGLMKNPYEKMDITSIDFEISVEPENVLSQIEDIVVNDSVFKQGETVELGILTETYLGGKSKYYADFKIPLDIEPGKYEIVVCGEKEYSDYLRKAMPQRYVAANADDLLDLYERILQVDRLGLYVIMETDRGGISVDLAELKGLPVSKAMVLADDKRTTFVKPFNNWIEKRIDLEKVFVNKAEIEIEVEK